MVHYHSRRDFDVIGDYILRSEVAIMDTGTAAMDVKKYTMTGRQAQVRGFLFALPFLLLIFGLFRGFLFQRAALLDMQGIGFTVAMVVIIVLSVPLHEGLHGIGWRIFGKAGRGQIAFRLQGIMPMCSCRAALRPSGYLAGVMMPFLVLGGASLIFLLVYPGTISLLTAVVNFYMAGADIAIAFFVVKSGAEEEAGFVAMYKE